MKKSAKRVWIVGLVVGLYLGLCMAGWAAEMNVSSSMQVNKGRLNYDFKNKQSFIDVTLQNRSNLSFYPMLKLVVSSISTPEITLGNPDGKTAAGMPYLNFSNAIGDRVCSPSEVSNPLTLRFNNPKQLRFSFTTMVLADDTPPAQSTRIVGPEGGTLEFHNSIILQIPQNAVTSETAITITDLQCAEVDPILSSHPYSSHAKRCIGTFIAEPSGLRFVYPITVKVPVQPLELGELPIQMEMDLFNGNFKNTPSDLVYDGERKLVDFQISHFSQPAIVATKLKSLEKYSNSYAQVSLEEIIKIEQLCTTCGSWDQNIEFCTKFYFGQDPCCLIDPLKRENCKPEPQCYCCKEKRIAIKSSGIDFSSTDCQIISDFVSVRYLDCPFAPAESYTMNEISKDCGDMNFIITIDTPPGPYPVCTEIPLKASISGKSADGKKELKPSHFEPYWESDNSNTADIISPGSAILGQKEGSVKVKASVKDNPRVKSAEADLNFTCHVCSLQLHTTDLVVGTPAGFFVDALDANGQKVSGLKDADIGWETSDKDIVILFPTEGPYSGAQPNKPGVATITANYKDKCEQRTANKTITVSEPEEGELIVQARIGNCYWDAPYCEYNGLTDPVPITVRAGVYSGGAIELKPGISITVNGYLPGLSYSINANPSTGVTDQSGEFHTLITPVLTVPYIAASVVASFNNQIKISDVRAVTTNFCYDAVNVYGMPFGTERYDDGNSIKCPNTEYSSDLLIDPISYWGSSYASALSPIIYDYEKCGNSEWKNFWDTLLIIPNDLGYLGIGINEIDVSFEAVGYAEGQTFGGEGINSGTGVDFSVQMGKTSNNSGYSWSVTEATNRTGMPYRSASGWVPWSQTSIFTHESCTFKPGARIGVPMAIRFQGFITGSMDDGIIQYDFPRGYSHSQSSVNTKWQGILTINSMPISNFKVYSCSGTIY